MRSRAVVGLAALSLIALFFPVSARASVHLNEIFKVMVGLNGNTTVQAVEIKMIANAEHFTAGAQINVYNASGAFVATLGTFPGNVPNGFTNRRILCATQNFATIFGITPDLIITPGLPVGTGQVSFEAPGCFVNALAYGSVTSPVNGTTSAAALPATGATALVRTIDNGTVAFCPLSEDAAARFGLVSGTPASPITFSNNFGDFVQVHPTAAGVDGGGTRSIALRVYPNPFSRGAKIIAPGYGHVAVYDISGRMVRSWGSPGLVPAIVGPMTLQWDGTDASGRHLPSGIYFAQYGQNAGSRARVVLLR